MILRVRDVTDLILTGVATNFVVEGTARQAADLGYRVLIARDCCASASVEHQNFTLDHILPFLATVTTSPEIIAALHPKAGSARASPGRSIGAPGRRPS